MPGLMLLQLPTDRLILEELRDGRNLATNIAQDIDRHRKTVNARLSQMEDYNLVKNIGGGLYELTERGGAAILAIDQYSETEDFDQLVEEYVDSVRIRPFEVTEVEPDGESA